MRNIFNSSALSSSGFLFMLCMASATGAYAQSVESAASQANADAGGQLLSDVVVTATRQADTVSRIPMSVTAITQRSLEQQSIRTVNDLQRITPGLIFTTSTGGTAGNSSDSNISIRGVTSRVGAATTGVYLDEIPLQKRNLNASGNGAPYPKIFDLERVEVLRGPQGTLYGGSSEGGTIRFITPQPSFTRTSVFAKTEVSHTQGGDWSYEGGLAVGGPIREDKIAFRASGWARRIGGYNDIVSRFSGRTLVTDANSGRDSAFRLAVAFRPTENLTVTPSYYRQYERRNDNDTFFENVPAFSTPALVSNALGKNCVPRPGAPCAYTVPAHDYPAINFWGPGKTGTVELDPVTGQEKPTLSPQTRKATVASIDFDWDLGLFRAKLISSYLEDGVVGSADQSFRSGLPSSGSGPSINYIIPEFYSYFDYHYDRSGYSNEFRLSSNTTSSRLTWVAGIFYSTSKSNAGNNTTSAFDLLAQRVRGVTTEVLFGSPVLPGGYTLRNGQQFRERELAGYAEATYKILEPLKITVGVRKSFDDFDYSQFQYGPNAGYNIPTVANGGLTTGKQKGQPFTPKVSLAYQVTERDMVYATVAKGFRMGGVNAQIPLSRCGDDLLSVGLKSTPLTYDSDSVWSYEGGAKLRLFDGHAQLNTSVYYIKWTDLQSTLGLPSCGFNYTQNVGAAVSKGLDLESQARLGPFVASLTLGYNDASFSDDIFSPANLTTGAKTLLVAKGDALLNTPKWVYSLGLQYNFNLADRRAYVRGDYQYQDISFRTNGPRASGYQPDIFKAPVNDTASMRAGLAVTDQLDLSLFATNLTNSQDRLYKFGGRNGTRFNPFFFSTTFRPREIGITASYRR